MHITYCISLLCILSPVAELLTNSPTDLHWNRQLLKFAKVHLQRALTDCEEMMDDDAPHAKTGFQKVEILCTR